MDRPVRRQAPVIDALPPPSVPAPATRSGDRHRPAARGRPVTPRWWADACEAAVWLSVLTVVALWVSHGGVQLLQAGPGEAMSSAGRLGALLAADLLLVQVVLMARLPALERAIGRATLTRWHRRAGVSAVLLLLAHVPLTVLGLAWQAGRDPVETLLGLLRGPGGIALAAVGAGLILLVAVTSATRWRRRLPYELWHVLHVHAYLGVGLAVPHQLLAGSTLAGPVAQAYWWAVWLGAASAAVAGRILVPAGRALRHRARVEAVVPEAPGVVSVHVRGRRLDALGARSGQFLRWRFLASGLWWQAHPYSLSAAPAADRLRFTARTAGAGSAALAGLRPGTPVLLDGPFGRFSEEVATGRPVTMLAAGIGVAPLRALLEDLPAGPGQLTLIHRVSSLAHAPLRRELDELAAVRDARVLYVEGPRVRGRRTWLPRTADHLRDDEALLVLVPDVAEHDVYVCGPPAWTRAAVEAAADAGVPTARIHTEDFSW